MPRTSQQDFLLWNSPKFLSKKEIFPNSLPFFVFCSDNLTFRGIFARRKVKISELFSVIQLSNISKSKRAATFPRLFRELFASPLLKQFWIYQINPLNFYVSGAETCRSRFSKIPLPDGLSRRVSVDISDYQNPHRHRTIDFYLTASQYSRRS